MAVITNTKAHIQAWPLKGSSVIKCAPGDTQVTFEQIKTLKDHPVFADFVKRGLIIVTYTDEEKEQLNKDHSKEKKKDEKTAEPVKHSQPTESQEQFNQLSQRELIKLISEMSDKAQLETLAKDARTRVSDAAKQQLESL